MASNKEKKKEIDRLKSMYPLRAKIDESYKKSAEAVTQNKATAWAMANWYQADPIFKTMDVEVLYPENYGAVVASSGLADKYLDISDGDGFPTHLCGYARINFGYTSRMIRELGGKIPPEAPMGGMPKPMLLLSTGHMCDARVKWFEALGQYMDTPVWMMETPTPGVEELFTEGAFDHAVKFIMNELREFIVFMERLLGRKMDWDKYDEVISDMIALCRIAHETFELRRAKPCPMHSRDFWSCMPTYLFLLGDLKESARLFQDLHDEMQDRIDNNAGAVDPEKYRLAFTEIPPWHSLGFFDKLAGRGWNFVVETWGYHPPIPVANIEKISDPLKRHAVFHLQFISARYASAKKDNEFYGYLGYPYLAYVRDFHCDGIFLHPIVTCRSTSVHLPYVRTLLMEKAKVPSLAVEGDIVDLRLFDPADALKKAEVFEEIMEHYREIRKTEGFDW